MNLQELLNTYKLDEESVFNTWFINNDERLKAFRSIRRGVQRVIQDIKTQQFGNDYKGSSHPSPASRAWDSGTTFGPGATLVPRFTPGFSLSPATRAIGKHLEPKKTV
ncbi:MAG: hypothetical protein L3K26_20490 [Candidatus Hydrogenedentes bacterium]|nr:hypothetical protein [Candidatus Hydrogenedentota bacterium]